MNSFLRTGLWVLILGGHSSFSGASPVAIPHLDDQPWVMAGVGYQPGTREVLFYEYHRFDLDDEGYVKQRYVEYRHPDGELKSVKQIEYRPGTPWTPKFHYRDLELDYQVGVDVTRNDVTSNRGNQQRLGLMYSKVAQEAKEQASARLMPNTVIDAGFDAYIQKVWPKLTEGDTVSFEFLAPLKLTQYDFSLKKVSENKDICELEMSLDWWPIDLLIDPVKLSYQCSSKQLMRYQGLTNLRDEKGDQYTADIHYQWFKAYPPFRF
ncbi:hypothetical protein [Litoribacillus peritrichatus]|uniref:DUF3108 domain-containing protein n=1 Tax=Litoribacillus peritrichatus TaxID=718191 RepID=A0ABP7LZ41_9GAMM